MKIPELYRLVLDAVRSNGLEPKIDVIFCVSSVDLMPKGVNKWSGLKYILEKYDISKGQVLGIGDTFTDVPWLREVGFMACPLNGTEDVRKLNGIYISDYEDSKGVGQILQHFILRHL
jgi:hydroxymethylpyrimidine pyrophosphatase-like HAD family hydrolase